VLLRSLLGLAT